LLTRLRTCCIPISSRALRITFSVLVTVGIRGDGSFSFYFPCFVDVYLIFFQCNWGSLLNLSAFIVYFSVVLNEVFFFLIFF
jgi:hypothetical protein